MKLLANRLFCIVTLFSLLITSFTTSNAQSESFVIRNVNLVNVETGKIAAGQDVFIEKGHITEICPTSNKKPKLKSLDGKGKYLIPGLWDFHTHALATAEEEKYSLPLYVINGVTGVRDLGSFQPLSALQIVQRKIEAGEIIGPRVILTGAVIDGPPGAWPGVRIAKTREDGIREANKLLDEGWQYLKTYSLLPLEAYLGVAEVAKLRNVPLIGHLPDSVRMMEAVNAGHKAIEHLDKVLLGCSTAEAEVVAERARIIATGDLQQLFTSFRKHKSQMSDAVNWERAELLAEAMAQKKMFVTPTIIVSDFYQGKDPQPADPRFRTVPLKIRQQWGEADRRRAAYTDEDRAFVAQIYQLDLKLLALLKRKGVGVLAGSDAAWINPYLFHGTSIHDEIERLVAAGFAPHEAIQAATMTPARFLGREKEMGKIEIGFVADLVLLDANPLEKIAHLRRINTVILRGRVLDRAALDRLQTDVEKQAAQIEPKPIN